MLEDLLFLEESENEEELKAVFSLIKKYYIGMNNQELKEFIESFEKYHITKNNNYYVGASVSGIPNTNNSLEGFNNAFKKHFTERKRYDMCIIYINYFNYLLI